VKLRRLGVYVVVAALLLTSMPSVAISDMTEVSPSTSPMVTVTATPTATVMPTASATALPFCPEHRDSGTYQVETISITGYQKVDDQQHKVFVSVSQRKVCNECDRVLPWSTNSSRNILESHDFDNNTHKCRQCFACDHSVKCVGFEAIATESTPIDKYFHAYMSEGYKVEKCSYCGQDFSDRSEAGLTQETGRNEHRFEGVECSDCGYVKECQHNDIVTFRVEELQQGECRNITDTTHDAVYNVYEKKFCNACSTQLSYTLVGKGISKTENHTFIDDPKSSWCWICRTSNPVPVGPFECLHENTETYTRIKGKQEKPIPFDDQKHSATGDLIEYTVCINCFETISEDVVQNNVTQFEDHDFLTEDKYIGVGYEYGNTGCLDCGYERECLHDEIEEVVYEDEYAEAMNQTLHERWVIRTQREICKRCRIVFGEVVAKCGERYKAHTFENGECTGCGFKNPCKHGSTETETSEKRDEIISYDKDNHVWGGREVEETICTDCKEVLTSTTINDNYTESEAHEYKDGACKECGYSASAGKPVTTPTPTPAIRPTYAPDYGDENEPPFIPDENPTAEPTYAPVATPTVTPTYRPSVNPTAVPSDKPSTTPTIIPTRKPDAAQTAKPTSRPEVVEKTQVDEDGWIDGNAVNVRAGAGTVYDVVAQAFKGDAVNIKAIVRLSDGTAWYEVSMNGMTGYVRSDLVELNVQTIPNVPVIAQEGNVSSNEELPADMAALREEFAKTCLNYGIQPETIISDVEQGVIGCLSPDEQKLIMIAALGYGDAINAAIEEYELPVSEVGRFMINLVGERMKKVETDMIVRSIGDMFGK